jgi:hypothetical protein
MLLNIRLALEFSSRLTPVDIHGGGLGGGGGEGFQQT